MIKEKLTLALDIKLSFRDIAFSKKTELEKQIAFWGKRTKFLVFTLKVRDAI